MGRKHRAIGARDAPMNDERIEVPLDHRCRGPRAIFTVMCDPKGHVAIEQLRHGCRPRRRSGDEGRRHFVVHMDRGRLNDYPQPLRTSRINIERFSAIRRSRGSVLGQIKRRSDTSRLPARAREKGTSSRRIRLVGDRPGLARGEHLPGDLRGRHSARRSASSLGPSRAV